MCDIVKHIAKCMNDGIPESIKRDWNFQMDTGDFYSMGCLMYVHLWFSEKRFDVPVQMVWRQYITFPPRYAIASVEIIDNSFYHVSIRYLGVKSKQISKQKHGFNNYTGVIKYAYYEYDIHITKAYCEYFC